jgi:hypothetical protein
MVFSLEFCDKIREILELIQAFENREKDKKYDIYLTSLPFSDDIEASIDKYLQEFCQELVEVRRIYVKQYKILFKVRKVFLNIEYGVNNDDENVRYDFYLSLMNKMPMD